MGRTIYTKLVGYFIGLIVISCLAASLLLFVTVGAPLARSVHRMIRNRIVYMAGQAETLIKRDASRKEMAEFVREAAQAHEVAVVLLDAEFRPVEAFPANSAASAQVTPKMAERMAADGIFVQPGHITPRTIYLVPLDGGPGRQHYLYITRPAAGLRPYLIFLAGLSLLFGLLFLAIYPLARSFTRPISRLSQGLERISAGDFPEHAPSHRRDDELRRLEEAFRGMSLSVKEMIASKKQLLADISHELRSPLGRMEASLELLSEECNATDGQQKHIRLLFSEINFMAGLVSALSAYAKINLPGFGLNRVETLPAELLDDLFDRNEALLARHRIRFRKSVGEDLVPIMLDPLKIFQVLQNLLDNARRYCPEGGEILLGAQRTGARTRFFVSDTGKGVEPWLQEKIFEPLFRADPSRSRETGGLGLGLAICKKIIELHGGDISYRRENGKSVFSFELSDI